MPIIALHALYDSNGRYLEYLGLEYNESIGHVESYSNGEYWYIILDDII